MLTCAVVQCSSSLISPLVAFSNIRSPDLFLTSYSFLTISPSLMSGKERLHHSSSPVCLFARPFFALIVVLYQAAGAIAKTTIIFHTGFTCLLHFLSLHFNSIVNKFLHFCVQNADVSSSYHPHYFRA